MGTCTSSEPFPLPGGRHWLPGWQALLPWVLVGMALAVRLYYLRLTQTQPVWWDEAEYLIKAKSIALGTPETGFFAGRPLFFSVVMAGVYALGLGERTIRAIVACTSAAAVYLTYRVGARLVDRAAAFVGAWVFSVFYVSLFYSTRIMTDIPHLALCLLGLDLFLARPRLATSLSVPIFVLAVFTRFPAALMLLVLAVYCVVSEGSAALRRREYWIGAALGVLVAAPFAVHSYVAYGDPLYVWKASRYLMPAMDLTQRLQGLWEQIRWLQESLGRVLTALLCGGTLLLVVRATGVGGGNRKAKPSPRSALLVILWLIVPFLYFGLLVRLGADFDRYLLLALPPAFLAIGHATARVAALAGRIHHLAALAVMVAVVGLGTVHLLPSADRLIRGKMTSYDGLRDAGLWIKERSAPDDIVLSRSVAQLTYYTERRGETIPEDRTEFDTLMATRKPRYVVISWYEPHPRWILGTFPEALGLRLVAGFPAGRVQVVVLEPLPAS